MFPFTFILHVDSFFACLPTYNASGTIIPILASEVPCLDNPVTDLYALSSSTTTLGDGVNKKKQRVSMSWRPCSRFTAIGHRGSEMNKLVSSKNCMKEIMANTSTSFNTAGQHDVRFVEFDVQAPESQGPHMDSNSTKRKQEFEAKSALMSEVSNKRRATQQRRVQLEKPSPSWLRKVVPYPFPGNNMKKECAYEPFCEQRLNYQTRDDDEEESIASCTDNCLSYKVSRTCLIVNNVEDNAQSSNVCQSYSESESLSREEVADEIFNLCQAINDVVDSLEKKDLVAAA